MGYRPEALQEPTPKEMYQDLVKQLNNIIGEQNKKIDWLDNKIAELEKRLINNGM